MTTVEHAWRIFKLLEEHWPTVPADDPGPKFPLDFSVRPSPRREGAVIVMFRSTRKYQKEKWAAFAEAAQMPSTGQGSPHSGPLCSQLPGNATLSNRSPHDCTTRRLAGLAHSPRRRLALTIR